MIINDGRWGTNTLWQTYKNLWKINMLNVNIQKAMEHQHVEWVNQLFLWTFSVAMFVYQRVMDSGILDGDNSTNKMRIRKIMAYLHR